MARHEPKREEASLTRTLAPPPHSHGKAKSVARLLDAGALTDVYATHGPAKGLTPVQTAQRYVMPRPARSSPSPSTRFRLRPVTPRSHHTRAPRPRPRP